MKDLKNKIAIVTGAASGIGLALAERLLAEEMKVVMADVEAEPLEREAARIDSEGGRVLTVPTDVRKPEQIERLKERTMEEFGAAHVVVNNAGVAPGGPMLESTPEDWRWVMDVNVLGVAYGVMAFAPLLVEAGEGHIVNIASEAGVTTNHMLGIYCASKHAVVGLTESLYRELEETPVGVSVVCPSLVRTSIFHSERNRDDGVEEHGRGVEMMGFLRETLSAGGMPPAGVADVIVQAIQENRFWVFTHPETAPRALARMKDIEAGRNPTSPYEEEGGSD